LNPQLLLRAHQAAKAALRGRVERFARLSWVGTRSLRDADVDALVARLVPVVQAGQLQAARLQNQYIAQVAALSGVAARGRVDAAAITGYRGVPAVEVYRRPAVTVYTALAGGATFAAAKQRGLTRLLSIVNTDMQQASNRQASASMVGSGFQYFRRVLGGANPCDLCVIASTQRYTRGDLMPIHGGNCRCGVEPLPASEARSRVIDRALLDATKERLNADPLDLIATNEHGELGPMLSWRADNFVGPEDF